MDPEHQEERARPRAGGFTLVCRVMCTAAIAGPVLYRNLVVEGDAYHFLALVVLAPVAGAVLFVNSVYCLFRYRTWRSASVSLVFMLVSVIGVLVARYFLPQFRMH